MRPGQRRRCYSLPPTQADARRSGRFCGSRLPRVNPCWADGANVSCLPHFFLQGEMKCGTTSMYKKLSQHPHVVLPRNKEVEGEGGLGQLGWPLP